MYYISGFVSSKILSRYYVNKREAKLAVSHNDHCLPLLPSGPGGVWQVIVAQHLTSQKR